MVLEECVKGNKRIYRVRIAFRCMHSDGFLCKGCRHSLSTEKRSCLAKTVGNLKNIGILVNRSKSSMTSMISMIRFNDNQCFEQLSLLHVIAFEFRDIWKNMSVILSRGRSSVRVGIDCQPPKTAVIKKRRLTDRKQNQTYRLRSDGYVYKKK